MASEIQGSAHSQSSPGPFALEPGLLVQVLTAHRKRLVWVGMAVWMAGILLCLIFVPRSYSSFASVAVQQTPGDSQGMLAAFSGISGLGKSYLGVVRSRKFAATAAQAANIQQLYHTKTEDDAIRLVQDGVTLDDPMDGLLYITVRLPAPPRLAIGASSQATKVKAATCQVASTYVASFSDYLAHTNTNRDAALVREAQKQLAAARIDYNASVESLASYIRSLPVSAAAGAADSNSGSGGADKSMGALAALYASKAQIETELAAGKAEEQGEAALAAETPQSLSSLPAEDPLLMEARHEVAQDATDLADLRIGFSDDNPQVVVAKQKLSIAQARLAAESSAVRTGRTSESVKESALQAQYADVQSQIAAAEKATVLDRNTAIDLEMRRNEVELRLDVLRTTASQFATLSVEKLAGNNMMDIVDTPEIPLYASPGLIVLAALCFFGALTVVQVMAMKEYCAAWYRQRNSPAEESFLVRDVAA